jgi:cytochrome c
MKKLYLAFALCSIALIRCSNSTSDQQTKDAQSIEQELKEEPLGLSIINESDCNTCHKADKKLIGPSYVEIVQKYPYSTANVNTLVDRIKNGSSGVWGDVAMPAHPSLEQEEFEVIVEYIYTLTN